MPRSMQLPKERIATSTLECQAGVLVVRRHHLLVRCSHWLNVPILLGLILSGVSIYWASPVYRHKPDPLTGNFDPLAGVGIWICAHVPGLRQYGSPPDWVYNHMSLGPGMLALALRLHWLCAYLFMLNGLVFVIGLAMGGGWRLYTHISATDDDRLYIWQRPRRNTVAVLKTSSASASVRERELRDFDIRFTVQGRLSVLLLDSHLPIRHVAGWVRSVLNFGFACSLPLEL